MFRFLNFFNLDTSLETIKNDKEYFEIVKDLLEHDIVKKMKKYIHHGNTTCFQHCLNVSYYNYKICKKLGLNKEVAARAGLLHDLFLYDWHTHSKLTGEHFHGLTHPETALKNAKKYFQLNQIEENIILTHMWPLTITKMPKYKESFIIVATDKYCGFLETLRISMIHSY